MISASSVNDDLKKWAKKEQQMKRTRIVHPPATAHPILWASQCISDESQKLLWLVSIVFSATEQGWGITLFVASADKLGVCVCERVENQFEVYRGVIIGEKFRRAQI